MAKFNVLLDVEVEPDGSPEEAKSMRLMVPVEAEDHERAARKLLNKLIQLVSEPSKPAPPRFERPEVL